MKALVDEVGRKVTFSPEAKLIPEFKALIDRDKSRGKDKALADLAFVYFAADMKSPYRLGYAENELMDKLAVDFQGRKSYKKDEELEAAIAKYEALSETPSTRLLRAGRKSLSKIEVFFDTFDLNKLDKSGKPIYKISDITNAMRQFGPLVKSLKELDLQVKMEQQEVGSIRGQRRKGKREDVREEG